MYENGQILTSPHGYNVVRVPLSPTQDVWLATDQYRGHFTDDEVAGWDAPDAIKQINGLIASLPPEEHIVFLAMDHSWGDAHDMLIKRASDLDDEDREYHEMELSDDEFDELRRS